MLGRAIMAATPVGIGAAAWAVRGRASDVFGPSVWRGPRSRRAVALTFDDGPSPATPAILDILNQYRIPATFFQCGVNVARRSELSRAVRENGHEIGNHSHTHPNFALADGAYIRQEFLTAQNAIEAASGERPVLMRAPYGVRWFGFRAMQCELHLQGIMWSVIGRDWRLPAKQIAQRVLSRAGPGSIICLHDGRAISPSPDVSETVEAVRRIVPALLDTGYYFQIVSDLLCPPKPSLPEAPVTT